MSRIACLLLLYLDGFKGVNDTFGHAATDEVLRDIADRIRKLTQPRDFVARLGGDEFVMLITRPCDCARIEDRILMLLRVLRHVVERDGERRSISASVSAAFLDTDVASASDLTHRADLALNEARRAQRGTGPIYGSDHVLRDTAPLRHLAG